MNQVRDTILSNYNFPFSKSPNSFSFHSSLKSLNSISFQLSLAYLQADSSPSFPKPKGPCFHPLILKSGRLIYVPGLPNLEPAFLLCCYPPCPYWVRWEPPG